MKERAQVKSCFWQYFLVANYANKYQLFNGVSLSSKQLTQCTRTKFIAWLKAKSATKTTLWDKTVLFIVLEAMKQWGWITPDLISWLHPIWSLKKAFLPAVHFRCCVTFLLPFPDRQKEGNIYYHYIMILFMRLHFRYYYVPGLL
jgi:hypothetical protein